MSDAVELELRDAVRQLRPAIGAALVEGLRRYVSENAESWSDYEIQQGPQEVADLADGKDCTYDRPSIGLAYASWYHPKRVDDMMRVLAPRFLAAGDELEFVDIGCGSGATSWAAAILNQGLIDIGRQPKRVTIHAADTSPFMIETGAALWAALDTSPLGKGAAHVHTVSDVSHLPLGPRMANPILIAGFFLDAADVNQPDVVGTALSAVARHQGCYEMISSTSPIKARVIMPRALEAMSEDGWVASFVDEFDSFLGVGEEVEGFRDFRIEIYANRGSHSGLLKRRPEWSDGLTKFHYVTRDLPAEGEPLTLHLDDVGSAFDAAQQASIAGRNSGPERIVGAAGSGKSMVLAHRVVETIRRDFARPDQGETRILVTCFNLGMAELLTEMFTEAARIRLPGIEVVDYEDNADDAGRTIQLEEGNRRALVQIVNLDKIPTRVLGEQFGKAPGKGGAVLGGFLVLRGLTKEDARRYGKYLSEQFLLDEINCVVAGQGATTWDSYAEIERRGRPFNLPKHGRARELIWDAVNRKRTGAFPYRWWDVVDKYRNQLDQAEPILDVPYDWVFVDEAQDFTMYQLRVVAALAKTYRNLVLAIDQVQSIRIGAAFQYPTFPTKWAPRHVLEGTYRLPVRIAEAARPLAEAISAMHRHRGSNVETAIGRARKAAVLGFRPIVVDGSIPGRLAEVLNTYLPRSNPVDMRVTFLQQSQVTMDKLLAWEGLADGDFEPKWVESIKGQERSAVVWSSGRLRTDEIGMSEIVYTIITRTTSLLILYLDPKASPQAKALVGRLDPSKLLFWTGSAADRWRDCNKLVGTAVDPLKNFEYDAASTEFENDLPG